MHEISEFKKIIDFGNSLITDSNHIHSLMKDYMLYMFTPQTYNLLKDLIYAPRPYILFKEWQKATNKYKKSFSNFISDKRVLALLSDSELKDKYNVALTMSSKAFTKIDSLNQSINQLEKAGILGKENVYIYIQTKDEKLIRLFDEVRSTSYYFVNNFESFLKHFINSLEHESFIIQKQIIFIFYIISTTIGIFILIFSFILSNLMANRIKSVEKTIRQVSQGDFTARLCIKSKDEFGLLSKNLNIFINDLKGNINSILNLMRDVGDSISNQIDFNKILSIIVEIITKDTNCDGAAIFLLNEYSSQLDIKAESGSLIKFFSGKSANKDKERNEHWLKRNISPKTKNNRPLFIKNMKNLKAGISVSSLIALPLTISKKVFGALVVVKMKENNFLTDLDFTNLSTFADYTALTIDNFLKYLELLRQKEVELEALQSQIHPHFLYNILSGLIGLNRAGERESLERTVFALQGMLRYTLEQDTWTTIRYEFNFLKEYCELQKIRFQERFNFHIDYSDEAAQHKIPKLLLQPLVENAIIHGIEPLDRTGNLEITAHIERTNHQPALIIQVLDDGMGFDITSLKTKKQIGLSNVRERLLIAYGNTTLNIKSKKDKGTEIFIKINLKDLQ